MPGNARALDLGDDGRLDLPRDVHELELALRQPRPEIRFGHVDDRRELGRVLDRMFDHVWIGPHGLELHRDGEVTAVAVEDAAALGRDRDVLDPLVEAELYVVRPARGLHVDQAERDHPEDHRDGHDDRREPPARPGDGRPDPGNGATNRRRMRARPGRDRARGTCGARGPGSSRRADPRCGGARRRGRGARGAAAGRAGGRRVGMGESGVGTERRPGARLRGRVSGAIGEALLHVGVPVERARAGLAGGRRRGVRDRHRDGRAGRRDEPDLRGLLHDAFR